MSADITEYLTEVDSDTIKKVFAYIRRRDVKVQFKTASEQKIATVRFLATESTNKINLIFKTDFELLNQEITFKIPIGTDVFFFKSTVVSEDRELYMYGPFQVFKLVRRKATRFVVPADWEQTGHIVSPQKKTLNSKVNILEISNAGMSMVVIPQLPKYEKNQQIQISFKIHKRSAVVVDGIIKHAKYSKLGGPTIGVEFIFENALTKNKIQNICDDLAYALAQNLAVKL